MTTTKRRTAGDSGFTLTEVVVALGILSILLAVALQFLASATEKALTLDDKTQLQAESRLVVDQLVRELRQASTDTGTSAVEAIAPDSITFVSPDNDQPFHLRRISYRTTGSSLERSMTISTDSDGTPWNFPPAVPFTPVLRSVRNTEVFTYSDDAGAVTTDASAVRTIEIALRMSPAAQRSGGSEYRTSVSLRATR